MIETITAWKLPLVFQSYWSRITKKTPINLVDKALELKNLMSGQVYCKVHLEMLQVFCSPSQGQKVVVRKKYSSGEPR